MIRTLLLAITIAACSRCSLLCASEEKAALEQLDFATGLLQRNMYQMAIDEYEKFIQSFGQSEHLAGAYFGIAESRYFLKQYVQAAEGYRDFVQRFPSDEKVGLAKLRLGESFFYAQEFTEAIKHLQLLEKEGLDKDEFPALYFYIAKAYRQIDKKDQALAYFQKVLKTPGESDYPFYASMEIADIYAEERQYQKAQEYFRRASTIADEDQKKSFALYKCAEMQFAAAEFSDSAATFKAILTDYPDSDFAPDVLVNLFLSLFNLKNYEDLVSEYNTWQKQLKQDEQCFEAHFIAACAYEKLDQHKQALAILESLAENKQISTENLYRAFLKKSEILLKEKRFHDALDLIDKELSQQKAIEDNVLFLKGEALYGAGSFAQAANLFDKLIEEFPKSQFAQDALLSMAYTQKALGEHKKARDLFVEYQKDSNDSLKSQAALYNAILLDIMLEDFAGAIKHCQLYLSSFPEGEFAEKAFLYLGLAYTELKRYSDAIHTYKTFIHTYPGSPNLDQAYFNLAYNLQLAEDFDQALEYYNKISPSNAINSLYYSSLKNKALIYIAQGKEAQAAEVYDKIISDFADNDMEIDDYLWLARHYSDSGEPKAALRILEKAEGRPAAASKAKEIFYFQAEASRKLKDYSQAIKGYDRALKESQIDVFSVASRIGKGLLLTELKQLDKAKEEFEAAIAQTPEDNTVAMQARSGLADVEYLQGNLEQAAKLYLMVAILYEDDNYCPRALLKAGEIFQGLGKSQDAQKSYEELVRKYQHSQFAQTARERLNALKEKD